jgi:hypothetical protein
VPAGNVIVATATDPANNTSEFSPCVTVMGGAPCMITCPLNQTAPNAPNQCGATVSYPAPTVSGSCGTVTCTPASGSFFPVGATMVNCTTTAGPSCSFTVTVSDAQAPTITCPANQSVNSAAPVAVTYPSPTANDNCPGATANCVPPSGSIFPVGITAVSCTAADAAGNVANCGFTVNVTTACTITCPPIQIINTNQCSAEIVYAIPPTSGACGTVKCSPAPGVSLPIGTVTVTCRTDAGPSCSFTIRILDSRPPTIACPANLTKATDPGSATATIIYPPASASDNCPGVTVNCQPPSGFTAPVGTTTVNCTARDSSNRTANCSFTATVTDSEPPALQCPANLSVDAAAGQNSSLVSYAPPAASDNLPGATVACVPPSGAAFPLGATTVNCAARDAAGNHANCSFRITVNGGPPTGVVMIPGGGPAVIFGLQQPVAVNRKPAKQGTLPCGPFAIQNSAFTPLRLTLASINRTGVDIDAGRISQPAEAGLYQLYEVLGDGSQVEIAVSQTVSIPVGGQRTFCLKFAPAIPALAGVTSGLRAPQAIPDVVNSRVTFTVAGGSTLSANVNARVETAFKFINPNNSRKPGRLSFASAGDEFIVSFSVFDSNMDVNKASYEFLDAGGNVVAGPFDIDLVQFIRDRNLVRGQSFTVEQRFTGARSHPEIRGLRVTVFDGETRATLSTDELLSGSLSLAGLVQFDEPRILPPFTRLP